MSLPIFLVAITGVATLALSASISKEAAENPTESSVETFDSYAVQNLPKKLALTIELPKEESSVQFYPEEPVPYLRAPQLLPSQPNFYEVPIPSEYLTAPTEGAWNPNDDPTLYYELPASITKENTPTNQYPKKFNKDLHVKAKPLSGAPKQEITLEPLNESQYLQKQKDLYKIIENLNKQENKKSLGQEKVPLRIIKPLRNNKTRPKDSTSHATKLTKPKIAQPTTERTKQDSDGSETNVETDEPKHYPSNKFTKGLSPHVTESLGIPSDGQGQSGRVLFHMAGHDGPMSYKWGYDTGKGHNRQFRFEERDKEGVVKGQFGYYDKEGKFRMMKYNAHPVHGFHMEPSEESEIKE